MNYSENPDLETSGDFQIVMIDQSLEDDDDDSTINFIIFSYK